MSTISNPSFMQGLSPRHNALPDAQFQSYETRESYSVHESLDTGLTIKTKEGDIVTLKSNSYAGLDAFMYNGKGVLQTESGTTYVTQNLREVTLTSGESFTFSVAGDLSEAELEDIEAIVHGIDQVISEMVQGDMDDAMAKAVSMGGYDTVSMYSADIAYQKTTAVTYNTRAETVNALPGNMNRLKPDRAVPLANDFLPENQLLSGMNENSMKNITEFIEKMTEELEKVDEKLLDKAREPIGRLFRHHARHYGGRGRNNSGAAGPGYDAIEAAGKQIEKQIEELINKMADKMFKEPFSASLE